MNRRVSAMIMAIVLILLSSVEVYAATVQPKVQETAVATTEVTANANIDAEAGKVTKVYPKSMQRTIMESAEAGKEFGKSELKRIQTQMDTLKDNAVLVDETGIAWKSGKGQNVTKVRVTSGKIQFEWTPIFVGYTWMSDLSMWSEGKQSLNSWIRTERSSGPQMSLSRNRLKKTRRSKKLLKRRR